MKDIKQPTIPPMPIKEDNEWLVIKFKDGDLAHYAPNEYTDYYYDKVCFVVIRDKQWIGIYNLSEIKWIEVTRGEGNLP